MYIQRAIEGSVQRISETFPVLLVTGPRQVGKTTLLTHLAKPDRTYVTLDDPDVRMLAKADPALFLQRFKPPLIIDEIQYAPEVLPYIKMNVDKSRANGDFWLTGSQMFHMMKNVSESLAGRVGIVNLFGLSQSEISNTPSEVFTTDKDRLLKRLDIAPKQGLQDVFVRIFTGTMPVMFGLNPPSPSDFYRSYINTYLQRDIKDLTQVADEMAFMNFMSVVAARTARPIQYEEIAREVGISSPTAKSWLSVLVSSGIIVLVQPYHNNILKRIVKMPLVHFMDTGLCAFLQKWGNAEVLESGASSGAFFESYVFSEIYKSYLNAGLQPTIYYYRDRDKREIDLLIEANGSLCPIEVKKTASPRAEAIRHFKALDPLDDPQRFSGIEGLKTKVGPGALVCLTEDLLPLDRRNWAVPAWLI
ncbi:MAG: ATP-binding protein [Coriobacteriaceae bacterium]|jgi:predicted AAA+ superfamily ATPase|nr:ATP-binding protein [Coriobacteriaceae bacterium]